MSSREAKIRDRIAQNDVTMMRSYLEVDVAEWFSTNEVPFGYEPFTIPSVVGPSKDRWDRVVEAIKSIGAGERDDVEMPDGSTMEAFDILSLWNEIYDKHRLQDENVSIPPQQSLEGFGKTMMLPDFVLYKDSDVTRAGRKFDWSDYDYIIEVSGLYGVGLPDESTESDWWDWYRVSAVAFKEFMYRLLGLWDDVYWVVPNQPYIEGVADGIPNPLIDDEHYIIMNTTQQGIVLSELAQEIGIANPETGSGLSPSITPTEYKRPLTSSGGFTRGQIEQVKYEYDGVNIENIDENENASILDGGFIVYYGELGEVYISGTSVHVRETQWRQMNMVLLREYVLDAMSDLANDGIVQGLRQS